MGWASDFTDNKNFNFINLFLLSIYFKIKQMAFLASSSTVYAQAYLTELGRQYLFDSPSKPRYVVLPNGQTVDRLKIERFSLGDPDVNYNLGSSLLLESGEIPNVTGDNEGVVTGAKGRTLTNLISPGASVIPSTDIDTVEYRTTNDNIIFNLNQAANLIPTVITQQLSTYIDGALVNDGIYSVTPTSYGPNVLQNNELIIVLKQPTLASDGYRMRIIFPSTGSNYNKFTIQFEKATSQQGALVTSINTSIETPNE